MSRQNSIYPTGTNVTFNRIDTRKLVAHFGGRGELHRRLEARGTKLSIKTIEKWMERQNIPAIRLVQLMDLAQHERRTLDLNAFVLRSAPNASKEVSPNRHEKQKDQAGC
jgi:carbamoylphosphate synthase small subunit